MRSAKTQLAASLWIKGDPVTGRRETSIPRLSALTGVSQAHLRSVKVADNWQDEAERYAQECRLVPTLEAGDLIEELTKDREVLGRKARELREKVDLMSPDDPKFEETFGLWSKVNQRWERVAGIDCLLEANRVRQVEAAKLQARADIEKRKREDELADCEGAKIVPV